jgi:hypothetical protein
MVGRSGVSGANDPTETPEVAEYDSASVSQKQAQAVMGLSGQTSNDAAGHSEHDRYVSPFVQYESQGFAVANDVGNSLADPLSASMTTNRSSA